MTLTNAKAIESGFWKKFGLSAFVTRCFYEPIYYMFIKDGNTTGRERAMPSCPPLLRSVYFRVSREQEGMTQEEVTRKLGTKKSAILRIENHAEDIHLSTLRKYAAALGKHVRLEIS